MMMLTCITQHLSNIWSSIHEKAKQHWGWVEKKQCLKKSVYYIYIRLLKKYGVTMSNQSHSKRKKSGDYNYGQTD